MRGEFRVFRGHLEREEGVARHDSQGVVSVVWVEVKCKSQDLELKHDVRDFTSL